MLLLFSLEAVQISLLFDKKHNERRESVCVQNNDMKGNIKTKCYNTTVPSCMACIQHPDLRSRKCWKRRFQRKFLFNKGLSTESGE
jgi:hypothetical protein